MAYLELVFSFALFDEHWFEHLIDLLRWGILAVTNPYACQQDEFLNTFFGRSLYQVYIPLQQTNCVITVHILLSFVLAASEAMLPCIHH